MPHLVYDWDMDDNKTHNLGTESRYVFWGLFCLSTGLLFLLINAELVFYKIAHLWPLVVFFCGGSLLCSGLYRRKRLGVSYLVPAVCLMLLGLFCLLFSLDIITESFTAFAIKWWPVSLIIAGIVLVALFFNRRKTAQAIATVMVDDGDNLDDITEDLDSSLADGQDFD